jgi:uncharacterized protein YjiS (DUF1127 family)
MKRMEGPMMITQSPSWQQQASSPRLALARRIRDGAATVVSWLAAWVTRVRQRELLAGLDRRMLRDIGLTPDAQARELTKPFWRE